MIISGHFHTVIQNEKNEIYACGHNELGQLGLGDYKNKNNLEKVEYEFGIIKKIACGIGCTVIQNEKNDIYTCGERKYGYSDLGLGDVKKKCKFKRVKGNFAEIKNIACGKNHIVIQDEKNKIYACGVNLHGQLGLGNNKNRHKFKKVEYDFGEVKNIACGEHHTVIQNEKNEIYVCGWNKYGQLGLGDNYNRNKFEKIKKNFGKIKNIACGKHHTVISNEKNEIYVCGSNDLGQLGLGDNYNRNKFEKVVKKVEIKKMVNGGLLYKILQTTYSLFFGKQYEKVEYNFGNIKKIACGYYHTIIQNDKNEIYVCGYNRYGQLGLGDDENRNEFEKIEQNFGEIKNAACGAYYTVIQTEKNEIYVCGYNEEGQLGLGDNKHRNKFEKVDTDDILERIYNFEFQLNTEEIVL